MQNSRATAAALLTYISDPASQPASQKAVEHHRSIPELIVVGGFEDEEEKEEEVGEI